MKFFSIAFSLVSITIQGAFAQAVIADAVKFVHADGSGVAEVIVDNGDPGFFTNGTWTVGQFSGGHGDDYLWKSASNTNLGTAHWLVQVPVSGEYDVFTWYSASTNRTPAAHYRIEHSAGVANVSVDQTAGGMWEPLGRYQFDDGEYLVQVSNRIDAEIVESLVIDDGDPLFQATGSWSQGTLSPAYGDDYLYRGCNTPATASAIWDAPIWVAGNWEIEVAFFPSGNRNPASRYGIPFDGGTLWREVDQSTGRPPSWEWHSLGTLPFNEGRADIELTNEGPSGKVVIADALRLTFSDQQGALPPEVEILNNTIATPASGEQIPIQAHVWSPYPIEAVQAEQIASPEVAFIPLFDDGTHGDGGAGDGVYGGYLPGGPAASIVEFRVQATTSEGGSAETLWQRCLVAYESFDQPELRAVFTGMMRTPQEIDALLARVRSGNFNAVITSVRSVGDANYLSELVPMVSGVPEGFDPLGYLIEQAHDTGGDQQRIEVHALALIYRALTSDTPPPGHILDLHPEWISENYDGIQYVGNRLYTDQGIPGVQDHLVEVFNELFTNYDIDGFNFDFIRYREQDFGYNPIALNHFHEHTGRSDRPAIDDSEWSAWRTQQVTDLVRRVTANLRRIRPNATVTIDGICWGPPVEAIEDNRFAWDTYQDWPGWLDAGVIDGVLGMAYRDESKPVLAQEFLDWQAFLLSHRASREATAIVGGYKNSVQHSLVQLHHLRESGSRWLTFFSERSFNSEGASQEEFYSAIRSQMFPTQVPPPALEWVQNPTGGIIMGQVSVGNNPAELLTVKLDTGQQTSTDLTGFYALFNAPPGERVVHVLGSPEITLGGARITLSTGEVAIQDFLIDAGAGLQWQ